jgi:hypothetical protein
MPRYRKKPVEIEAMQMPLTAADPQQANDLYHWVEYHIGSVPPPGDDDDPRCGISIDPGDGMIVIRTLEGDMKVSLGDWVIRGVQGEFYPCKPDIFAATYDAVS